MLNNRGKNKMDTTNIVTIKKYNGEINRKESTFSPNSVLLLKESFKKAADGVSKEVSSTKVVTISGLKEPKPFFIVRLLLTALVAEKNVQTKFNKDFGTVTIDEGTAFAKQVESGISAREMLKPFLSTNAIFRTDNEGKIVSVVQIAEEGKLSDTVLNLNKKSALVTNSADKKFMKAAINNAANAFLSQINYWSAVGKEIHDILTMCDEKAAPKAAKAEKPKKEVKNTSGKNVAQIRAELAKGNEEKPAEIDPIANAEKRLQAAKKRKEAAEMVTA